MTTIHQVPPPAGAKSVGHWRTSSGDEWRPFKGTRREVEACGGPVGIAICGEQYGGWPYRAGVSAGSPCSAGFSGLVQFPPRLVGHLLVGIVGGFNQGCGEPPRLIGCQPDALPIERELNEVVPVVSADDFGPYEGSGVVGGRTGELPKQPVGLFAVHAGAPLSRARHPNNATSMSRGCHNSRGTLRTATYLRG